MGKALPGLPGSVLWFARRANRLKWEDLRGKGFVTGKLFPTTITCWSRQIDVDETSIRRESKSQNTILDFSDFVDLTKSTL